MEQLTDVKRRLNWVSSSFAYFSNKTRMKEWSEVVEYDEAFGPVSYRCRSSKLATRARTSRVIMKPSKHSLTPKNESGSVSVRRALSIAVVRPITKAFHSSSTSRSERKESVVARTWFSTMKKPEISCVRDDNDARGSGDGRMRADCA